MAGVIFMVFLFLLKAFTTLLPIIVASFLMYTTLSKLTKNKPKIQNVFSERKENKQKKEELKPQVLISEARKREAQKNRNNTNTYENEYDYSDLDKEYKNRYEEDCGCKTCEEVLIEKKDKEIAKKDLERKLRKEEERKQRDERIAKEILVKQDGKKPAEESRGYAPIKEDCKCIAYKKLDLRSAIIYKEILGEPLSRKHNRR